MLVGGAMRALGWRWAGAWNSAAFPVAPAEAGPRRFPPSDPAIGGPFEWRK